MKGYLDARKKADADGVLTFGELAKKYGYNVIAFASRISLGWTLEEIISSKRDGLEFSKKATFDFTGKQHSTAGLFCAKYNIDVRKLTELTEKLKTCEEFNYIMNVLTSHNSGSDKLIDDFLSSISHSTEGIESPESDSKPTPIEVKVTDIKVSEADISLSSDDSEQISNDIDDSQSVNADRLMTEKAKEIRKSLISNKAIVDIDGTVFESVSEFLQAKGLATTCEKEFTKRVAIGFSVEDAILDVESGAYIASEDDAGEFDFKDGIDGKSFVDFCKQNGISPQYVLTKYRRGCITDNDVKSFIETESAQGTLEACINWFVGLEI